MRSKKRNREESTNINQDQTESEPVKAPAEVPDGLGGSFDDAPLAISPLRLVPLETRTKHRHDKGKSPIISSELIPAPKRSEKKPRPTHPPRASQGVSEEDRRATSIGKYGRARTSVKDFRRYETEVLPRMATDILCQHLNGSLAKVITFFIIFS